MTQFSTRTRVAAGLALVVISLAMGLLVGARSVSIQDVFIALTSFDAENNAHLVVVEGRIPRSVAALLIGALVAVSGGLLQGVTRNQLADPGIMGLNASSSLAVLVAAALGVSSLPGIAISAFSGALAGVIVLALMSLNRKVTPLQIAVAGIAIAAGLASLSSFLLILIPEVANSYRHWMLGSLVGTTWNELQVLAPVAILVLLVAMLFVRVLNALALGSEQSQALGVTINRHAALIYLVAALATGVATAFAGPLMFIGLLAPHIAKFIGGHDFRASLPITALAGGVLLLLADVIGRIALQPAELDAGIVISILGAPLVILIMRRYFK